jgi:hypothetical protein
MLAQAVTHASGLNPYWIVAGLCVAVSAMASYIVLLHRERITDLRADREADEKLADALHANAEQSARVATLLTLFAKDQSEPGPGGSP